ncbi:chaplin [Streptomyces flaveolus]|uniref:chaplin n=1 Tax=Streptomyces flaveolus TaxID=67297 RepID=UPI0033B394B3
MNIAKKAAPAVTAVGASAGAAVASGRTAQVPVDVPVQADGLTSDLVGAPNPAFGNTRVSR